ncbi:MAG TPA: carboxylesterase family protein [Flavobacteriales bacterium]|nr:carboxylesterase family protein [Flavobacteriales bacterium]
MHARYATLLGLFLPLLTAAQECGSGRYVAADVFSAVTTTSAVPYGSNIAVAGGTQTLRMDVYEPTGDTVSARPVVIVAFGGSFIAGTRADVADICTDFAKRGYVAVAPDYRVGFFLPNATTTTRAVMRGAHDMKAAVRYLRKSVAELGNPYHIDTTRIISGGVSAGAISAIHAVYLDQDSEIPSVLSAEISSLGGVEGNSGSPGYSSEVFAAYSFSGAIGDTSWIATDDTPIASIHDIGDVVVPYNTQEVSVAGIPTGLIASGSHDLHLRADNVGVVNCLKSYPGTGHVAYLTSDPVNAMNWTALFLGQLVCGGEVTCGATGIAAIEEQSTLSPFPNPTADVVRFSMKESTTAQVLDADGRVVLTQRCTVGANTMDMSALRSGVYVLRVGSISQRVVKY